MRFTRDNEIKCFQSRQSHEPSIRAFCMGRWSLNRCECGHSYGTMGGSDSRCLRCGSTKSREVRIFDDPQSLSEAVAASNMPKEIADELEKRISSYNLRLQKPHSAESHSSQHVAAMMDATGDDGQLPLSSLSRSLERMDIHGTTAEKLIGQAEFAGRLIREGQDTWSWLQQSS